jgi:hypothetical protein
MTDLPLPTPRAYALGAAISGVYMLVPVLVFACLLVIELLQMRTSTASATAVLGGVLGLAGALFLASRRRQRENLQLIEHLPPEEQARWQRIVVVHGRSARGMVLVLPLVCLLGALAYGLMLSWPWSAPTLGEIAAVGLTAVLVSGTLTWSLMWLLVAWSAWSEPAP